MRIYVDIDVNQPLKRWKNINMGNGESSLAKFKYEKLYVFCFICGKLDHTESLCDKLYDVDGTTVDKGWGHWLKAVDHRGTTSLGNRWLGNEEVCGRHGHKTEKTKVLTELMNFG
ncbi:hypothetical protein ACS0TY_018417 [Phlomoides rotata]